MRGWGKARPASHRDFTKNGSTLFSLWNPSFVAALATEQVNCPTLPRVQNPSDEPGMFAAFRAAWGSRFTQVFSQRLTIWIRRELAILSVINNSRGRIDDDTMILPFFGSRQQFKWVSGRIATARGDGCHFALQIRERTRLKTLPTRFNSL